MIVSPHVDDAPLSCGALLARSEPVDVLDVFAGEPKPPRQGPWDAITGFSSSTDAAATRRAEEAQAFYGSPHRVEFMDLLDAQYVGGERPANDRAALVARVTEWAETTDFGTIVLPAGAGRTEARFRARIHRFVRGDGFGQHPDHVFVRDTVLASIDSFPHVTRVLYEELPYLYNAGATLQAHLTAQRRGCRAVGFSLTVDREAKAARIAAYKSQVRHICMGGRRLDDPANVPTTERYWRLVKNTGFRGRL